jgi:hypothetical protein
LFAALAGWAAACSPSEQLTATSAMELEAIAARGRPVRQLVLYGPGIDDAALAEVAAIRGVEGLVVEGGSVGPAGMAEIARLPELRALGFKDARASGFAALAGAARLERLALHGLALSDADLGGLGGLDGLDGLGALDGLAELVVTGAPVGSHEERARLEAALPAVHVEWREAGP